MSVFADTDVNVNATSQSALTYLQIRRNRTTKAPSRDVVDFACSASMIQDKNSGDAER